MKKENKEISAIIEFNENDRTKERFIRFILDYLLKHDLFSEGKESEETQS
ncbi:MAG: hypothetical protein K0R31_886 [Clostridiales bacterium]|jgi:hypothetical protein|nr:hypothetical protein [Clostridiales bacterium]